MARVEDRQTVFKMLFSDSFGVDIPDNFDNEFIKDLFFGVKNNQDLIDELAQLNQKIRKKHKDIGKLKNYFNYGYVAGKVTLGDISNDTGITIKNLPVLRKSLIFANEQST